MGTVCTTREKHPEDEVQFTEEEKKGEPVYLNVYDLMGLNATTHPLGIGVYHTGVQVYGREYSYAGHYTTESTGLRCSKPCDASWLHDAVFREHVLVGYTKFSADEVNAKFDALKDDFLGPDYNVLDRNCNHFTARFIKILTRRHLPAYVNRIMNIAEKVRPCLPDMFTSDLRDMEPPEGYVPPRIGRAERLRLQKKLYLQNRKREAERRAKQKKTGQGKDKDDDDKKDDDDAGKPLTAEEEEQLAELEAEEKRAKQEVEAAIKRAEEQQKQKEKEKGTTKDDTKDAVDDKQREPDAIEV